MPQLVKRLTIMIDEDLHEALKELAKTEHESMSTICRGGLKVGVPQTHPRFVQILRDQENSHKESINA